MDKTKNYKSAYIISKHPKIIKKTKLICQLLKRLIDLYQNQFPKELLLLVVPQIDLIKINLFKKMILVIIENPKHLWDLYYDFFKDLPTSDEPLLSQIKTSKLICSALKKTWLNMLNNINNNKINNQDKRRLNFYFNIWLMNLTKQHELIIDFTLNKNMIRKIKNNCLKNIINCLKELINNEGYLDLKNNLKYNNNFKIGHNIAACKGTVIYKNDLIEVLSYQPNNTEAFKTPLLLIPPCINKYYLFDLLDSNSLIKWLLSQGFIIYAISWVNPFFNKNTTNYYRSFYNKTFNDYLVKGILQAIDIVTKKSQNSKIHLAGYCMGGSMLSCILSYLEKIKDFRIASVSFFMSLLDFSNFNNLDPEQLDNLQTFTNRHGYLDGKLLSMAFNIVHANELIWPYFINHYLLEKDLLNFDKIYWNCDPINLSAKLYNFYLRDICLKNKLLKPNCLTIKKIKINIKKIKVPIFSVAGTTDRISPWENCYKSISSLKYTHNNNRFILAQGGHVSAFIVPPSSPKINCYKIFKIKKLLDNNTEITKVYKTSSEYQGSWWSYWIKWLKIIDPSKIATKIISIKNSETVQKLTVAPGTYIKQIL